MESNNLKTAQYIVNMIKSVRKDLKEAIDRAVWYTYTDADQKEVEKLIAEIW